MTTPNTLAFELAAELGNTYAVTSTQQGWIEIRLNPEVTLRGGLEFVRILVTDVRNYRLVHLTSNEVLKGEITFIGTMCAYLPALVREFCETEF